MKTRYLRRFRKTYSWHYDHERNNWVLFNKKTMIKMRRKESFIIIALMLNAYFSLDQIISYIKRKERILDKKENS